MQIWDTAGQESYKSVTRVFYRGAHIVFITYDVTRSDTFDDVADWVNETKQHASEDARIYLVGNKSDLDDRQVTFDKALEFAKAQGLHLVWETSAKEGDNVMELFSVATKDLLKKTIADEAENAQ